MPLALPLRSGNDPEVLAFHLSHFCALRAASLGLFYNNKHLAFSFRLLCICLVYDFKDLRDFFPPKH